MTGPKETLCLERYTDTGATGTPTETYQGLRFITGTFEILSGDERLGADKRVT